MLAQRFDFVHISIGRIIRWHIEQRTKLASEITPILDSGNIIPDRIIEDVVRRRLAQHDWNFGFVLDGFPRRLEQAEFLRMNWDIDCVVYIDLPDEVVVQRVRDRAIAGWGAGYSKRADTDPTVIRRRVREYHRRLRPILRLYNDLGILTHVDGMMTESAVFSRITRVLGLMDGPV